MGTAKFIFISYNQIGRTYFFEQLLLLLLLILKKLL